MTTQAGYGVISLDPSVLTLAGIGALNCPFCEIDPTRVVFNSPLVVAIRDGFPVSRGHTLVIPRKHIASWFDATEQEQLAIWRAVDAIKTDLDREFQPAGYNIGINVGESAGQTVMHLHVHVIPRFGGDVDDPAGGVRFVIPTYGNYKHPGKLPRAKGEAPFWFGQSPRSNRLTTGGEDPFDLHIRPALRRAKRADIVAAFVQDSGVDHLDSAIATALERGADFRVVTGDYLHITQSTALRRLLDWSRVADTTEDPEHGTFEVRVVETASIDGRSFHPKSWRIESDTDGVAWVGSSNWSLMALTDGVEWNLRVDRATDPGAYAEVVAAFGHLWDSARLLTQAWLDDYAARARKHGRPLPQGDGEDIRVEGPFQPIGVQPAALEALEQARAEGRSRSLVVLATGLGKTFLAAFDVQALAAELGRTPRVLFIAHRRELLVQAAKTFRKVFPDASIGFFVGSADDMDTDFVFASVQKLALDANRAALAPDSFDYVVVDESHHAPARSYRRVLKELDPRFLLGLTATPDRADQADVAGLFDDHIAFQADLGEGIDIGRLVPFDYAGLPDTIEFEAIPWRRYSVDQLAQLAETEARMERLRAAWEQYPGKRTLVFCVSIRHADYVADWLSRQGVRIVACHTGENSADRDTALERLERGDLDAVAAVDLFNEGIDVPLIDRVVMLRPTASPVVFLQQLGRGLRVADGKERLQVVDFIGNHKVFLNKIRTLLSLAPKPPSIGGFLGGDDGELELRGGCRVNVDLEVIDMLRKFLPSGSGNEVVRVYRELRDAREERPTPGELVRMGLNPRSLKTESWFAFVQDEGDLSETESAAFEHGRDWFRHVEVSAMTKSFKMVVLEVLLEEDALFEGMTLERLAARSHDALRRDPSLRDDIDGVEAFESGADSEKWRAYWKKNPVKAWTGGKWFGVQDGRLVFTVASLKGEARDAFQELTRELADMRLATYRRRNQGRGDGVSSFTCKVISNKRNPILKLPDGDRDRLPMGETDVRTDDGRVWQFKFVKIACNVARPIGSRTNSLPDLLRRWFGPSAGKPGTDFRVRFRRSPEGWWVEPLGLVVELPDRGEVVAFPSLRAAAGAEAVTQDELFQAQTVRLPFGGADRFAVRASGDSMNGGANPIRDGDWVVLEWARGLGLEAVAGRVCLLSVTQPGGSQSHHLKRVVRLDDGVLLCSDNPLADDMEANDETTVIARLVEVVTPEQLAPPAGSIVPSVRDAFDLSTEPTAGATRVDGHLFILVDQKGVLTAPSRLNYDVVDRAPSETAFVLTSTTDGWRYAGVGRWADGEWVFTEVDFATWRALGEGRTASRELDEMWLRAASNFVEFLCELRDPGDTVEGRSRLCRFQGVSAKGGVRIDHDSMNERTVSLLDIGWVLQAYNRREENGGLLDETWVNYLRYLEGTPKASTRWIDTGWALVLLDHAIQQGFVASLVPVEVQSLPLRIDGKELDATVHFDRNVLGTSVVLEARGGTAGSTGARNTEYSDALSALLKMFKARYVNILDAYVDSQELSALPVSHRRLDPGTAQFPVQLEGADTEELATSFRRSMSKVGREPDAKGSGNSTRRIRIEVDATDDLSTILANEDDRSPD